MYEEEEIVKGIKVGAVQFKPTHKDVQQNITKIGEFVSSSEADLLVFPELSLSGYAFSAPDEILPYTIEVESPQMSQLQKFAETSGTALVIGFAERDGENIYNSAVAINALGIIECIYRKVHLFYYERYVFEPGDMGFPGFDLRLRNDRSIRLGMQICYDWRFPEAARSLTLNGADVIAIPSNIVTNTGMLHKTLQVRAFENKVIVIFADRIGSEDIETEEGTIKLTFRGESAIVNMNGNMSGMLSKNDEGIIFSEIFPGDAAEKAINQVNNIIEDRRTDQYFD